jgi:hypothetical protein
MEVYIFYIFSQTVVFYKRLKLKIDSAAFTRSHGRLNGHKVKLTALIIPSRGEGHVERYFYSPLF